MVQSTQSDGGMNCFEFRRLILADPRRRTQAQQEHQARCSSCAALAKEMESFEAAIHDAAAVPVPEGLAERILLRQRAVARSGWFAWLRQPSSMGAWALAASLVIGFGTGAYFFLGSESRQQEQQVLDAAALGERHPAVAAISYVLDNEPRLLAANVSGDMRVMREALARLGLKLPVGAGVRYLGKCPVPNGEGEHLVLDTPYGRITLILVPDQVLAPRVVVSYRAKAALAAPVRSGGFILVANSPETLAKVEKMLM
jgi:hypothetical protein